MFALLKRFYLHIIFLSRDSASFSCGTNNSTCARFPRGFTRTTSPADKSQNELTCSSCLHQQRVHLKRLVGAECCMLFSTGEIGESATINRPLDVITVARTLTDGSSRYPWARLLDAGLAPAWRNPSCSIRHGYTLTDDITSLRPRCITELELENQITTALCVSGPSLKKVIWEIGEMSRW